MEIGARQTIGRSLQWVKIGPGTYLKDLPGKGDPAYWTKNFMKTYKSYTKKIDSFKKYTLGDKEFTKDAYVRTYRYVPKREGIGFGQKLAVFKARGEGAFYKFKELPKEKVPISYVMGKQYTKPTEKLIFGTERGTINIGGKKIDYQETFMEGIKKLDKDVGRGLGGKVSIQMGGKQTGGQALIRTQDIKIPEGIQSSALNIGLLSRATEGISYSFREMPTKLVPPLQTQKLEPPKTKTHTILLPMKTQITTPTLTYKPPKVEIVPKSITITRTLQTPTQQMQQILKPAAQLRGKIKPSNIVQAPRSQLIQTPSYQIRKDIVDIPKPVIRSPPPPVIEGHLWGGGLGGGFTLPLFGGGSEFPGFKRGKTFAEFKNPFLSPGKALDLFLGKKKKKRKKK
jgi:hypothetical protein